ncbi:hypothetical protein [Marinobacter sp.]|uniref:hypothetical protein n=1 Tax=Marinobacter sp. TaxID=50741 RepID=UPI003B51B838
MTGTNKTRPSLTLSNQKGFVVTVELILIITILVLGSLVGLIAIRDALFKHYVNKQSTEAIVADAPGKLLGKAVDFDEHDAPRIFLFDRTLGDGQTRRTLIGVRDDRFTSREAIYYSQQNCSGTPCIKTTSDETTDSVGADAQAGSGNVSYFNALQGFPNYAVGRGSDGLPGALFRETTEVCPVDIQSRWVSQKVVAGEPCEAFNVDNQPTDPAYAGCLANSVESCECPGSYEDESDVLDNYVPEIERSLKKTVAQVNARIGPARSLEVPSDFTVGTLCCREAYDLDPKGLVDAVVFVATEKLIEEQLDLSDSPLVEEAVLAVIAPLEGGINCTSFIEFRAAESVPAADNSAENALEQFEAPFWVNAPSGQAEEEWFSTEPTGSEGR